MEKHCRIVDANLNRAREGLRVLEDVCRFTVEDALLTGELRALRHRLVRETLAVFPRRLLLGHRASDTDAGRHLPGAGRRAFPEMLAANFSRVSEAMRAIEEICAVYRPGAEAVFHEMRFSVYTLEKRAALPVELKLPAGKRTIALVEAAKTGEVPAAVLTRALAGNTAVQLRVAGLDDRRHLAAARTVRRHTAQGKIVFLVENRPDIAAAAGADGINLTGAGSLPVAEAQNLCPGKIVGVTVTCPEEARAAQAVGAGFVAVEDPPADFRPAAWSAAGLAVPVLFVEKPGAGNRRRGDRRKTPAAGGR